ncbi:MAG: hypothetical protein AAF546_14275 [Verrucomicrobiota bacterium]
MGKQDSIVRLGQAPLREHFDRKITESVEDTTNGLLDAERISYEISVAICVQRMRPRK